MSHMNTEIITSLAAAASAGCAAVAAIVSVFSLRKAVLRDCPRAKVSLVRRFGMCTSDDSAFTSSRKVKAEVLIANVGFIPFSVIGIYIEGNNDVVVVRQGLPKLMMPGESWVFEAGITGVGDISIVLNDGTVVCSNRKLIVKKRKTKVLLDQCIRYAT